MDALLWSIPTTCGKYVSQQHPWIQLYRAQLHCSPERDELYQLLFYVYHQHNEHLACRLVIEWVDIDIRRAMDAARVVCITTISTLAKELSVEHDLVQYVIREINKHLYAGNGHVAKAVPREKKRNAGLFRLLAADYYRNWINTAQTYESEQRAHDKAATRYRHLLVQLSETDFLTDFPKHVRIQIPHLVPLVLVDISEETQCVRGTILTMAEKLTQKKIPYIAYSNTSQIVENKSQLSQTINVNMNANFASAISLACHVVSHMTRQPEQIPIVVLTGGMRNDPLPCVVYQNMRFIFWNVCPIEVSPPPFNIARHHMYGSGHSVEPIQYLLRQMVKTSLSEIPNISGMLRYYEYKG